MDTPHRYDSVSSSLDWVLLFLLVLLLHAARLLLAILFRVPTWRAGFVIFLALTIVTVFAKPVPLALGSPQLVEMENQLYTFARSNWVSARSTWSNVRRLEAQMTEYGRTNLLPIIDDIAAAEAHLVSYGSSGYRGLELRVFRAAAALLDITWPVKRWPVYVFTAGAMACLLTSTVCHLFGCCARHVSQLIWRFDYVGIALLIVCSFYPPVYYGKVLPMQRLA